MSISAQITKKGQVTIPKRIREKLGTDIVEFDWADGVAVLKLVKSQAGSLHKYAGKQIAFEEAREQAWMEVVREPAPDAAD